MITVNEEHNRIDVWDERYYQVGDNYYPSVTFILDAYPKGKAFEQWLKDVGNNAKYVAQRAAESGSKVHNTIETILSGVEVEFDDSRFEEHEWAGVCKFMEFYERFQPEVVAIETTVFSDKYQYAGTLDLLCKINGEKWLIDYKFSNAIHNSYFLQLAAYRMAIAEKNYEVDRMGILWLKANTRTEGRGDAIQGKGWQMVEPKQDYEHLKKVFLSTLQIFREEHPTLKPRILSYPLKLKI
jgi:hypothetical protein